MAKMECSDEVSEKHVKEARRLLSKSIIRVEQPAIDLDEGVENDPMDTDEAPAAMQRLNQIDANESGENMETG